MSDTSLNATFVAFDLTHILYEENSKFSELMAFFSLSPILLMASYAALAAYTREYIILVMWTGQFFNEGLNLVIKQIVKQDRPVAQLGSGYGFPSSHSQYMSYFTTFLLIHTWFRHRFASTGSKILDQLFRLVLQAFLVLWMSGVAYSRYHLLYHTPIQVFAGLGIGSLLGATVYALSYLLPTLYPNSPLGLVYRWILDNELAKYVELRDGWAVWADAGREDSWKRWRAGWDEKGRTWNTNSNNNKKVQ